MRRLDRGWAKLVVHTAHRGNMRFTVNLLDAADEVAAGIAWLESLGISSVSLSPMTDHALEALAPATVEPRTP